MISPLSEKVITQYINNEYHTMWIEDGIIIGHYKPNLKYVNLELAKRLVKERLELCNGRTFPILANIKNLHRVEPEAKQYFSSEEARQLGSACAIVVNNVFSTLLANFYIKVSPAKEPIKLFTNEKKAFIWLKQFRHLN